MGSPQVAVQPALQRHLHVEGEKCPYCDQSIPNAKAQEIRARLQAEDRDRTERLRNQLTQQFTKEKENAVSAAHDAAVKATEAAFNEKLAATQQEKNTIQQKFEALKAQQNDIIDQRVCEAREALENDKNAALNKKDAAHAEEIRKANDKLADLQRQLAKEQSAKLGEGAEIDLFDELKRAFKGDHIERIRKGAPGADIRHIIVHGGRECGKIVYDAKNRVSWRNEYVEKLASDQRADKADHAILSTLKFPADKRQICEMDGVIVANPARVIEIARLLRKEVIRSHSLRLSNMDRSKKKETLYSFITSKRFGDKLDAIDTHSNDLLELQAKEKRAHDATWKRQGILVCAIQKVRGDLRDEIDAIVESE